jgi:hypothetical protein
MLIYSLWCGCGDGRELGIKSQQSKVKESKVKESRVKESRVKESKVNSQKSKSQKSKVSLPHPPHPPHGVGEAVGLGEAVAC